MKKSLLFFGSVILFLTAFGQSQPQTKELNPDFVNYLYQKNNGEISNITASGHYLGEVPSPLKNSFSGFSHSGTRGLPVSYDLRTVDGGAYLTPVKNQGLEGACWAFATYAAIESYWKKQGLSTYNLSEQNLATCHGFDWTPAEGGNYNLSAAYLSRNSGPISESDDPYTLPANPTCVNGLTPVAYVAQFRELPGSESASFSEIAVKEAIMDYGAIYTNMYYDDDYISGVNYTYFYNGSAGTNHGVAIVGWDDNKVVTGGIVAPTGPGAWIIKNSWGTSWGQSGYFYISYEDTEALTSVGYFPSYVDYNVNSELYFYDEFGATSAAGYSDGEDFALIKYVATGNQQISKLGTFILDANTTIAFDVYDNFNGTTLSGLLGSISGQVCALPGYYTFDLSTAINITTGNDFYVKVRYNSGENYPIPTEKAIAGYCTTVPLETAKCWISDNGTTSWTAIGTSTSYLYDACIKVYATTLVTAPPVADFSADATIITAGESVYFTDLSTGVPTSWSWVFEGGTPATSNLTNPSVTYNTPGTYDVTLTVTNGMGSDEITKTNHITVTSYPISCLNYDNDEVDDDIVYYKVTGGYLSGVNSNSFPEFAEHYTNHQNYLLTGASLGVIQADVLSADAKITMKVWNTVSGKPGTVLYSEDFDIADFTSGSLNDITFATPTTVPEDFFIGYQIYFTTPQDTFAVTQVEDRGTSSTVTSTAFVKYSGTWRDVNVLFGGLNTAFSIYPEICPSVADADFSADVVTGCGTLSVQFTDESTGNVDSWLWDFGDGFTSTEQNPEHIYNTAGTYTVSLTATNFSGDNVEIKTNLISVGVVPTDVSVSGGGTQCGGTMLLTATGGTGGTIYWQNTTNNGTSSATVSSSQTVSASGTYYFRARSADGCWGTQGSAVVTINAVPTNAIVSGGGTQCGGTMTLTATGGTGGTMYWQNTTSGGTSTTTASSSQVVSTSGIYYFRAQSAAGCWGNEGSAEVIIHPSMTISLSHTDESAPGANDASITVDITGGTPDYFIFWFSGDDITSSTTYLISGLTGGSYPITVTDNNMCDESANETIYTISPPVAEFEANQTLFCDEFAVNFSDLSEYNPTSWEWNFGDGQFSTEQNPTHTYLTTGVYSVSLVATNAYGGDQIFKTDYITISESPVINFETIPAMNEYPYDGEIHATVSGGSEPYTIEWGHDSEETSLDLTGLEGGDYYLTISEAAGCQSSVTIIVDIIISVEDYSGSVKIYPNPATDYVMVDFGAENANKLEIVNLLGEILFSESVSMNSVNLDVSEFNPGCYFINIAFSNKTITQKLIIR